MTADADRLQAALGALVRRLEEERDYLEHRLAFVAREILDLRARLAALPKTTSDTTDSNGRNAPRER